MFGSSLFHLDGGDRVYNIRAGESTTSTTTLIYLQDLRSRRKGAQKLAGLAERCIIVSGVGLAVGAHGEKGTSVCFFFFFFLMNRV